MREKFNGNAAWAGLIGGVIIYDALCPETQTLSEAVDRALEDHKLATIGAVAITAAHLCNILPSQLDPLHHLATTTRRLAGGKNP